MLNVVLLSSDISNEESIAIVKKFDFNISIISCPNIYLSKLAFPGILIKWVGHFIRLSLHRAKPYDIVIKPNWLKGERVIIFLKSYSKFAVNGIFYLLCYK